MFTVRKRYQYRGPKGLQWTQWFDHSSYYTKEEAKTVVRNLKMQRDVDHLQSEYDLQEE